MNAKRCELTNLVIILDNKCYSHFIHILAGHRHFSGTIILMSNDSKPYLLIKESQTSKKQQYDGCYLIYNHKHLEVTATDYALLQGLLSDEGLNCEEAGEERQALNTLRRYDDVINDKCAHSTLTKLRTKILKAFPELIIPISKSGGGAAPLRLYTRSEINKIQEQIANPEKATYVMSDEQGYWHLFIDGHEICPIKRKKSSIGRQHLVLASILLCGRMCAPEIVVNLESAAFRNAWETLTRGEEINPTTFKVLISQLKKALEPWGWTINKASRGRGNRNQTNYQLVPFAPNPE